MTTSSPTILFSPWVPQPLPDTGLWMIYRTEKRFDSEGRWVSTVRHTLTPYMPKDAALSVAQALAPKEI